MDLNSTIQQLILSAPPLLFALTFHELAHGYVAWKLGDPTAKEQGRLTMNPLKHLDPFGVLAFIIMRIGWAKPVPVNPRYFRNPQQGMLLTALAGPVANIILAIVSAVLVKILGAIPISSHLIYNVIKPMYDMMLVSVWINVMLAVFNFLPIPPLDGSKVLMGILPPEQAMGFARLEPYGFLIILVLFYMGLISKMIMPIVHLTVGMMVG
ncbi:MAG: site-2 protease family protein [Candidatus Electrothrix aestuarii]|uniref:Site-2 protease family protein n=1 Tax=Candidatus Electrothrix aestuarii TaxID=3062594 RepID=A0AAU8LQT6_9BACT|nr:site-2 protease family protein [Candidatus Electrothrix aestuarii]